MWLPAAARWQVLGGELGEAGMEREGEAGKEKGGGRGTGEEEAGDGKRLGPRGEAGAEGRGLHWPFVLL